MLHKAKYCKVNLFWLDLHKIFISRPCALKHVVTVMCLFCSGRGGEKSDFWLGPRRIKSRGHIPGNCGAWSGLHLRFHRGRDAWKVSVHIQRLHQAKKAMDSRILSCLRSSRDSNQIQISPHHVTRLVQVVWQQCQALKNWNVPF